MSAKFVAYRRVSTQEQGKSGLGLEAQSDAVAKHVAAIGGLLIGSYVEVESGRQCNRPELAKALAHAKRSKATLLVAKLDRLSRNTAFLCSLLDAGVDVVACDNPTVNRLTLQILAVLAENEARSISERTKAALAALKARGEKLGSARPGHWDGKEDARLAGLGKARIASRIATQARKTAAYADLLPDVTSWRENGVTLQAIADKLNDAGHTTRRGRRWSPVQVQRLLAM
jgi:DNA invertase Pin-like site-specific DNA recombinase